MVRTSKRLTARFVETVTGPGQYADGDGLYLVVGKSGARRWAFIFQWHGKRREMGLGSFPAVSLSSARDKALEARRLVSGGTNPIDARNAAKRATKASAVTFGSFAEEIVPQWTRGMKNAKHKAQWLSSLKTHAAPLWPIPLGEVDTEHVLGVLSPVWQGLPETASRVRGRIERILDGAKVKGLRQGENPARWRGHLSLILPKPGKLTRGHHAALPYKDLPEFWGKLAGGQGMGAIALRFIILTGSRPGEAVKAQWPEIDFDAKVWTVPPERMKAGKAHRVPLSDPALAILKSLYETRTNDFVFPGQKPKAPISAASVTKALDAAGGAAFTVHGTARSSFRDWVGDATSFPEALAELALAHTLPSKTEAAYRRSDALEKRRDLMRAWASYLEAPDAANVVPIRAGKKRS